MTRSSFTHGCLLAISLLCLTMLGACSSGGDDSTDSDTTVVDGDSDTAVDGDSDSGATTDGDADSTSDAAKAPFRFVILSDTHTRIPGQVDDGNNNTTNQGNIDNLTYAVNRINTDYASSAFVVVTGDMVGCNFSESADDYGVGSDTPADRFKSIMSGLTIPMYTMLGNHDYYINYQDGSGVTTKDRAKVEAIWKKLFNIDPYYSIVHNGVRFIFANSNRGEAFFETCSGTASTETGCTGSFDSEQLTWLENELKQPEPALIFFHHPPITDGTTDTNYFSIGSFLVTSTDPFYQLAKNYKDKILGIFVGHGHIFAYDTLNGIPVYETGSIGDGNRDKENMHVVDVDPGKPGITVTLANPDKEYFKK